MKKVLGRRDPFEQAEIRGKRTLLLSRAFSASGKRDATAKQNRPYLGRKECAGSRSRWIPVKVDTWSRWSNSGADFLTRAVFQMAVRGGRKMARIGRMKHNCMVRSAIHGEEIVRCRIYPGQDGRTLAQSFWQGGFSEGQWGQRGNASVGCMKDGCNERPAIP